MMEVRTVEVCPDSSWPEHLNDYPAFRSTTLVWSQTDWETGRVWLQVEDQLGADLHDG